MDVFYELHGSRSKNYSVYQFHSSRILQHPLQKSKYKKCVWQGIFFLTYLRLQYFSNCLLKDSVVTTEHLWCNNRLDESIFTVSPKHFYWFDIIPSGSWKKIIILFSSRLSTYYFKHYGRSNETNTLNSEF